MPLASRPLYFILIGTTWAADLLVSTMLAVYYIRAAGLTPLQLAVVGIALAGSKFIFEIPTGVVADSYSRRLSIIIGALLTGGAHLLLGGFPQFSLIIIAQLLWGLGSAFTSGATTAWIADELGSEDVTTILVRGVQIGQLCGMVSIIASGFLVNLGLGVPILLGGGLMVGLGLFLMISMTEHNFTPAQRAQRQTWQTLGATTRAGISLLQAQPALWFLFGATVAYTVQGEGIERFWEAHFLANFRLPPLFGLTDVTWFSALSIGAMLCSMAATGLTARWLQQTRCAVTTLLFWLYPLVSACILALALARTFGWGVAAFWAMVFVASPITPLFEAHLNRQLDSATRATMLSFNSQMGALGGLAGGLVLGVIADVSLRGALVVSAAALLPAMVFMQQAVRKHKSGMVY